MSFVKANKPIKKYITRSKITNSINSSTWEASLKKEHSFKTTTSNKTVLVITLRMICIGISDLLATFEIGAREETRFGKLFTVFEKQNVEIDLGRNDEFIKMMIQTEQFPYDNEKEIVLFDFNCSCGLVFVREHGHEDLLTVLAKQSQ